jgi:site-specific recombinase XerD
VSKIRVESGPCPITNLEAYALYDGDLPVVAATVYLRHLQANVGLAPNTVASYAYSLLPFFDFLNANRQSFWNITQATIKQYRRFYLNERDKDREPRIRRKTARHYLHALKGLVGYWRGFRENDPLFVDQVAETDGVRRRRRRRGALSHLSWYTRVPSELWQVNIPGKERQNKRAHKGLSGDESRLVMSALDRAARRTDIQVMLYYRDRAIYTFLLMSCLRKGELVRVRLEDVVQREGVINLRDRPEDCWLGELKTGPATIFVSAVNPYWQHLNSWLTEGRWIAEKLLRERELDDHGLLFCNRDGGPLTQAAVDHLFTRLKTTCGFKKSKYFSPHVTRHTMATVMLNNGVGLTEVQRHLRHANIASTQIYAEVTNINHRAAMENFWKSVRASL